MKNIEGKNNPNWKGDNVGIGTLHVRVEKVYPKPKECEFCDKKRKLELANLNHKYNTKDLKQWKWLCHPCHNSWDRKHLTKIVKCKVCGKIKKVHLCLYKKQKNFYCSRKCFKIGKTTKILLKCNYCKKDRFVMLSCLKNQKHFFCSHKCSSAFRKTKVKVICNYCGKIKEVIMSKYKKQKNFYCSNKHQNLYYKSIGDNYGI